MNQNILAALLAMALAPQKCNRTPEPALPPCVQARIEEIKKQPPWNPPASVTEYRYDGRQVFLFSSNCCDQFNEVVDAGCKYVCAPSGGITGKGDRKCTDFNEQAQLIKLVWKDERN